MKKRIIAAALLSALLVCASCAPPPEPEEGEYLLYYQNAGGEHHGPALRGEPWDPKSGELPAEPEEMLRALLAGPTREGLSSPFPKGVSLVRVDWDPREEGKLRVRLSEAYSGLSDISLTLADYAIVLTLAQLEGVESVEIQTSGYSSNYRSHSILRPEEALILDPLGGGNGFS